MKTVIIDDEKPAREYLNSLIKKYFNDQINVIGEADSVSAGIEILSKLEVDLVFLDINLFDGSGFNILEEIKQINFQVIFITAYNDYAIRAFRVNALDYILKPINIDDLRSAIQKAKQNFNEGQNKTIIEALVNLQLEQKNRRIAIHENDGIRFVNISQIVRCKSDNNYTEIYLADGEKIISSKTLKDYCMMLEDQGFFRIHQSHLVRLSYIKKILKRDGVQVELENGDILDVSRRKKEALSQKLLSLDNEF